MRTGITKSLGSGHSMGGRQGVQLPEIVTEATVVEVLLGPLVDTKFPLTDPPHPTVRENVHICPP